MKYQIVFGVILVFIQMLAYPQQVRINELMASNQRTIADGRGNYDDWIELFNPMDSAVDLAGYFLSDDSLNLAKFRLSQSGNHYRIPGKGFLLLWASSNPSKGPTHLGFGLSAGGEMLYLVAPDGNTIVDNIVFGVQKADISFGRTQDGAGIWAFFTTATPGKSNNAVQGFSGFLNPPSFSQMGGFHANPFSLELHTQEADAQILFTLDGSEPDPANIGGKTYSYKNAFPGKPGDPFGALLQDTIQSFLFTGNIPVSDRTHALPRIANKSSTVDYIPFMPPNDIFKGTTIRARVIKDGFLPSDVVTQTYFVSASGKDRFNIPVSVVTVPPQHLFGYEEGIYTAGSSFDQWRRNNPNETNLFRADINFRKSGASMERVGHFEYYKQGETIINQRIGVRLHGSSSRFGRVKTLRLYARPELGANGLFQYSFFQNYPLDRFSRLLLRPDDWERTAIRDFAVQQIARGLRFDIQQGQPSVLFINGEFWGLHTVRERYDDDYFRLKYGFEEGSLDLLEDNAIVEEGDNKDYLVLRDFIKTANLKLPSNWDSVMSRVDIENFTDYFINGIFISNRDWPHNNVRMFRKNSGNVPGTAADGRWRWLLFDTDASYTTSQAHNNDLLRLMQEDQLFLKYFLEVPGYRNYFINRYADLLNSVYETNRSIRIIDSIAQIVAPFVPEHRYRLFGSSTTHLWSSGIQDMRNFAQRRPVFARQHLMQQFNLPDTHRVTVMVNDTAMGTVKINSLLINRNEPGISAHLFPWHGIYFAGIPITLIAVPKPGYRFVKWQGDTTNIRDTLVWTLNRSINVQAIFEQAAENSMEQVVHFWHFNHLPAGSLSFIPADSSLVAGAGITYPGTGAGFMDRVAGEGSLLNGIAGYPAATALRVRNPSLTRELILQVPSTGFENIAVSWATVRTNSGAQEQRVFYADNNGLPDWKELPIQIAVTESFRTVSFSLSQVENSANNPDLKLRILFGGTNAGGSSGNNRFDNIVIKGNVYERCNGAIARYWYKDADNDGYSDGSRKWQCIRPVGFKPEHELKGLLPDCDDMDSLAYPGAIWYGDLDNDGYGNGNVVVQCLRPAGYKKAFELITLTGDCRDDNEAVNPATKWYKDLDADGYGDDSFLIACIQPAGYRLRSQLKDTGGDCDDNNADLNPETDWFSDRDGDGYSDGKIVRQCSRPSGFKLPSELISVSGDCDDDDMFLHPATIWYKDADNDGYSDGTIKRQCLQPQGYKPLHALKAVSGDCNDQMPLINPETVWYKDADDDGFSDGITMVGCERRAGFKLESELLGMQADCDDRNPDIHPNTVWVKDADNDGFGEGSKIISCIRPNGFALENSLRNQQEDCNDNDSTIYPGAPELHDGKDNDCNSLIDDGPPFILHILPNPVQHQLRLVFKIFTPGDPVTIRLIGSDGRVYATHQYRPMFSGEQVVYPVSHLLPGIYFVQVRQNRNMHHEKIMLIR